MLYGVSSVMAEYWVDVDRPTNRATVYRDECIHAQDRNKNPEDGYWKGNQTLRQARLGAVGSGMDAVRDCPVWLP